MAYTQSSFTYGNGKVAIPKLDRGPPPPPRPAPQSREDRVTRACKSCRKRKVKCSGHVPRCVNCQANELNCVYEAARRDRLKEAIDLNHTFITLFSELSVQLSEEDQRKVQDVIDSAENDMLSPQTRTPSINTLGKRARQTSVRRSPIADSSSKDAGEAHVTASVGSNEDLDYLDEDLLRTRESRETGYVGQNSEVQWLRSVQRQSQSNEGEPYGLPYGPPGVSEHASNERSKALHERRQHSGSTPIRHVTDATFYLDSDNIELDIAVNPYELPDPEIAEQLLHCYMSTVNSTFPVLPLSFDDQVRRFISSLKQGKAFRVPDRWRALLNLVFAIGAKYSHLIGAEWKGDERDHLVYMTRASHLLGMNNSVMFTSAPDMALVHATAMLSFYFLVIGHVSRAWLMVGIATRFAMALGLHLRNEDPGADASKKDMLLRTWWSLHSIECLVSSITGRPPAISTEDCTIPLPQPSVGEDRATNKRHQSFSASDRKHSNSSFTGESDGIDNYSINNISIGLLTHKVLSSLYAPRTASRSWQEIQGRMKNLLQDLEEWSSRALSGAASSSSSQQREVEREHLLLLMRYWGTKILITRPCLCRTERRIRNESDSSAAFNSEMASICVNSARELAALFPHTPDLAFVYRKGPWWNIVHIIMQGGAVLLLELGYQSRHSKENNAEITTDIKKLINWLDVMQQYDPVAQRAHNVMQRILQNVAPAFQDKAAELLTGGQVSRNANEESFRPFVRSHKGQNSNPNWAQGEFYDGTGSVSGHHYYPQDLGQHYQDSMYPPQDYLMYESNFPGETQSSSAFGNPFTNAWDQGLPFVGLQNTWHNPDFPPADMPEDLTDMQLYPGQYIEERSSSSQQQQGQLFQSTGPNNSYELQQRKKN